VLTQTTAMITSIVDNGEAITLAYVLATKLARKVSEMGIATVDGLMEMTGFVRIY
jgi:hypothetical protein